MYKMEENLPVTLNILKNKITTVVQPIKFFRFLVEIASWNHNIFRTSFQTLLREGTFLIDSLPF